MKTLENKATSLPKTESEMVKYSDLLISVLNKPLKATITLGEMRRDLKLSDTLEASGEVIELPDADFDYLAGLVEASEWAIKHIDILTFADDVEAAKQVKGE